MGGEKTLIGQLRQGEEGSPPRGRGKVCWNLTRTRLTGITPAWAGKSFSMTARGKVRRDHPRVGGEKGGTDILYNNRAGSPPRGRGKD